MGEGRAKVGRWGIEFFHSAHKTVQSPEAVDLIRPTEFRIIQGTPQHPEGFVIGVEGNWERMAVFASMRERKIGLGRRTL